MADVDNITRDGYYEFPAGYSCEYKDSNHRYYLEDGPVAAVSSILEAVLPKNLSGWAERNAIEGVCLLDDSILNSRNAELILEEMKALNLRYFHTRNKAGARGELVHSALEALAAGRTVQKFMHLEEAKYISAIAAWWFDHSPTPVMQEVVVASAEYRYAGRFDLLARIHDELWLIDLKTSKDRYESHDWQLALYEIAGKECGVLDSDAQINRGILLARPDGSYTFYKSNLEASKAIKAVEWFKVKKEWELALNKEKRVEKKAKDEQ